MLYVKFIIFFIILMMSSYYDLKKMIVPDWIAYTGILTGILFVFFEKYALYLYYLSGGIAGFVITLLVSIICRKIWKKEMLGGGDIKLCTAIGFYIGYIGLLLTFIISSITGILIILFIYKDTSRPVPFAFCLSIGGIIVYAMLFFFS